VNRSDPASAPGTRAVRRLSARLLAATVLLTSPAWIHGAVTQAPAMAPWWNVTVVVLLGLAVLDVLVAGALGVLVRGPAIGLAVAVAVAVVTWPVGVADESAAATRLPWLWLVLPPALAAVATLDRLAVSIGYGAVLAAAFVSYRTFDLGGSGPPGVVALEGVLILVIGVGLVLLVRTATTAARRVDDDASRAAAARADAASLAAAAAARADVDAVLHDRVLAALALVAGSPGSPRVPEAARRALEALGAPREPDPDRAAPGATTGGPGRAGGAPVELPDIAARIASAVAPISQDTRVAAPGRGAAAGDGGPGVPERVVRAIVAAAAEAVRNSVRHGRADEAAPTVTVAVHPGREPGSVRVEVRDDGRGFRPEAVPPGRLGLRVSVLGRMRAVGGRADVVSGPGLGTAVVLRWPVDPETEPRAVPW
jgi:signal transduction histidine kinase